ncbi:MAG: ribose-phosphate pyrophosphokinase-like domain-containing protein, partial [Planctomycetes bacterium]|nr:ribose-phosphate pyrophosphokinase-like domain-containing protein [Planctomycetota bacterium]
MLWVEPRTTGIWRRCEGKPQKGVRFIFEANKPDVFSREAYWHSRSSGGAPLTSNSDVILFSLEPEFGRGVAAALGVPLAAHEERDFEDGEHKMRPLENVRGRDVYVICTLYGDARHSVNDKLVRLLFFLGALRDASAGRLTAVVPYLCYARKDRKTKARDPVATRYVAGLFESVGTDRVLTLDVHNPAAYE